MKILTIAVASLLLASCSTYQNVTLPPQDLHREIASGNLIEKDDRVKIYTSRGSADVLVKSVTATHINGVVYGGMTAKPFTLLISDVKHLKIQDKAKKDRQNNAATIGACLVYVLGPLIVLGAAY